MCTYLHGGGRAEREHGKGKTGAGGLDWNREACGESRNERGDDGMTIRVGRKVSLNSSALILRTTRFFLPRCHEELYGAPAPSSHMSQNLSLGPETH